MIDYRYYYDADRFSVARLSENNRSWHYPVRIDEHYAGKLVCFDLHAQQRIELPLEPLVVNGSVEQDGQHYFVWQHPRPIRRCFQCGKDLVRTTTGKICPQGHGRLILDPEPDPESWS